MTSALGTRFQVANDSGSALTVAVMNSPLMSFDMPMEAMMFSEARTVK